MTALKLRLLGDFEIAGPDGPRLATRKAEALLAYLALPAGQAHRRDKLAGFLWGDKDERRAHHNLAQALHLIRKALNGGGAGPLIADGQTVALDSTCVEVDVAAFEQLAGQQTAEAQSAAVDLYRGDLLDGVDIRETAFEDWLRGEQVRLRAVALNALEAQLRHHLDAVDDMAAIDTGNRILALDPIRESVHCSLMRLYCRAERQEAAIRQYQSCADILECELGIEPGEETKVLYAEILGERTVSERSKRASQKLPDKPSIAVLPFDNLSGDPEQEYFADGIAEDVITALSRFHSLFVIARTSSFTYKGLAVDVTQVARELGVRYVVEGSVRKAGNRVRITAQLIDAATGSHLWADRFDGGLDDVFDLQDQITEKIVVAVVPEINLQERQRGRRKRPENLDAWELLQQGQTVSVNNRADSAERTKLYRDAIALDPEFAAAHANLAMHLFIAGFFGLTEDTVTAMATAREAAQRALFLDPNEPMAHLALGRVHLHDGLGELAISEMETAIGLNPNFAWAHHSLGFALYYGAGNAEEALPHYDTALRLSPCDYRRWSTLMNKGVVLRYLGRYDEAITYGRQACKTTNCGYTPYMHLAASLAEAGQMDAAHVELEQAMRHQPDLSIDFIRRRRAGMHKTALKILLDSLRKAGVPE